MKYITYLLLLTTALFSNEREVESITYRSQSGATIALIHLTDGSVWKWIPDTYSENLLRCWRAGDPVIIQSINHQGLGLKNLYRPHYVPIVSLSFNSYPLYPTIRSADPVKGYLELSDGTKWELLYDFNLRALHYWTRGDRIIAVEGVQKNFELINLDIPYENACQIERFVHVAPAEAALCQEKSEEELLSANRAFAIMH